MEDVKLNKQQLEAVNHKSGPLMVVAGAGTGKTKVIVEKISNLIASGVNPESILALTFTEKAAAEMQDRVNESRGGYTLDVTINTFNGFGNDILQEFAAEIGLGNNMTLLGDTGQLVFMREHLDEFNLEYYSPISKPDSQLENIAEYISKLKQNLVGIEVYKKYANNLPNLSKEDKLEKTKHTELSSTYATYIKLCRDKNIIDYDDQVFLSVELLKKRPNILKKLSSRYEHILVDEFQDTNPMQSKLVDLIAENSQSLTVVGDDDQSIYGWRGATLSNILDFSKKYPKAKQVTLKQNYRSTQQILDSAYKLIQNNNPNRLESMENLDKQLKSNSGPGELPKARQFTHINAEMQWICADIINRINEGEKPGSIAILARRNKSIELIHEALESSNIEHDVAGISDDLYRQPSVSNLLEALRVIFDKSNSSALYHVLGGPIFKINQEILAKASEQSRKQHLLLADALPDDKNVDKALNQIQQWRKYSHSKSVGEIAYSVISDSGWKKTLYANAQSDPETAAQAQALGQFFTTLKDFERVSDVSSLQSYLDNLPALKAAGNTFNDGSMDLSGHSVNVLSVHKAKGLEWDTVYIFDCTEGSFPMRGRSSALSVHEELLINVLADDHMAEERRLMYVAATRAKNSLVLTYSETHTGKTKRLPSRFITELLDTNANIKNHENEPSADKLIESFAGNSTNNVSLPSSMINGDGLTLSASQIDTYLKCPLEFYYRYILQVPQPDIPAMKYGTLVHKFIQRVHESISAGNPVEYEDLMEELEDSWPMNGYPSAKQRDRAHKSGKESLTELYERLLTGDQPSSIEEPFRVVIPDAKLTIIGRIDAIYDQDSGIEIIDYKTGTSVSTPEKAKSRATASNQLSIYALAWRIMHGEMPAKLTLDFVETNQQGSVKKQAKTMDNLEVKLADMVAKIKSGIYIPSTGHHYCTHPLI